MEVRFVRLWVIVVVVSGVVMVVHVLVLIGLHSKPCVVFGSLPAVIVPFRVARVWVIDVATLVTTVVGIALVVKVWVCP